MDLNASARSRRGARTLGSVVVAVFVLGLVLAAALWTGPGMGGVTGGVETLASNSGTLLGRIAGWLPLGLAFGAGMVSAVNPCGFAMLPAYLGLFVGASGGRRMPAAARFRRAALVSASTTASFVAVFAVAGGVVAVAARALEGALPWLGLATGVVLVVAGAGLIFRPEFFAGSRSLSRLAPRGEGPGAFAVFGVGYALASLGCTLPVFVAILGGALAQARFIGAVGELLAYALGMGVVVTVVTFLVAALQTAVASRLAALGRVSHHVGTALLLLAGAYVTFYWLTVGGVLAVA